MQSILLLLHQALLFNIVVHLFLFLFCNRILSIYEYFQQHSSLAGKGVLTTCRTASVSECEYKLCVFISVFMQINEHQRDFADNGYFLLVLLAGWLYFFALFLSRCVRALQSNVNFSLDIMK